MRFLQQAKNGLNEWWMYPIVIVITFVGYFLGQVPLLFAVMRSLDSDINLGTDDLQSFFSNPDFSTIGISNNIGLLLLLVVFIFALVTFYFIFTVVHKRAFTSLISPLQKLNWKKVLFSFLLWFLLAGVAEGVLYYMTPETYALTFNPRKFAVLFIIAILILPIQTSFEEILFRGYIMQGIGSVARQPWIPLVITSLLFGLVHSSNPEVASYGLLPMQFYYVSAGLFLGLITILDDSLDLALGVHAATNIFGALILSYEGGAMQTDSLFKTSTIDPIVMSIAFIATAIIFILICYKRYNWPSLQSLFQDVQEADQPQV